MNILVKKNPLYLLLLLVFLLGVLGYGQTITGRITTENHKPIGQVLVFIPGTNHHTQTDEAGFFTINWDSKAPIYIQKEGYENQKIKYKNQTDGWAIHLLPLDKRNILYTEQQDEYASYLLSLVYAHFSQRTNNYQASYYAKGDLQLNTQRSSYLGQKRKDLDPALDIDSEQIGNFIYLSEIASDLDYRDKLLSKETVHALQERGNSKDLLFLTGTDNDFNIFSSEVSKRINVISPLLPYANTYYFFDIISEEQVGEETLYRIYFSPKRDREPIMEGYIEFTSKNWQVLSFYAKMKGNNVNVKNINNLQIKQTYTYSPSIDAHVKASQTLVFDGKFIVFDFIGKFESSFSHYTEKPAQLMENKTNEYLTFTKDYNLDEDQKLASIRPFSLMESEKKYFDQKSIFLTDDTKSILDSIDKRTNNFTVFKLIKGYKYVNSYKNTTYSYHGLLSTFAFNAVQGFNITSGLDYTKLRPDNAATSYGVNVSYGFSENKFRFSGYASHVFNQQNYSTLRLEAGEAIEQFNQDDPIKKPINSFASAWFGKNYAKYFQKKFLSLKYSQYAFTNFKFEAQLEYAYRKNLYNNIQNPPFVPTLDFTSNNPLDPTDFESPSFKQNEVVKLQMNVQVVFDQKTISYPTKKQYIQQSKYPILEVHLEKALNTTDRNYSYTFGSIGTKYQNNIGTFGELYTGISIGQFFEQNKIPFTDFKHFNGNQTFIGSSPIYNKQFNLLPYYEYSTNKSYVEFHMEHDFRGFLINKIPLLNKTRYSIIVGFHLLHTPDKPTYKEFGIGLNNFGFGKFRPFRIDYFTSFSDRKTTHGVVLGVKILDLIQK
ncbi:carboxypeptidase regulatory-like domain-containing protein [Myroides sp. DF42-4-2]|nr:carboxypeptidase regulatory-like domain-containing protein [Myroides sp. DF42-4-2]